MKTDIVTVAIVVFCLGVLATSVDASGLFDGDEPVPSALQQGIATR